jgi:hypothetical protein
MGALIEISDVTKRYDGDGAAADYRNSFAEYYLQSFLCTSSVMAMQTAAPLASPAASARRCAARLGLMAADRRTESGPDAVRR